MSILVNCNCGDCFCGSCIDTWFLEKIHPACAVYTQATLAPIRKLLKSKSIEWPLTCHASDATNGKCLDCIATLATVTSGVVLTLIVEIPIGSYWGIIGGVANGRGSDRLPPRTLKVGKGRKNREGKEGERKGKEEKKGKREKEKEKEKRDRRKRRKKREEKWEKGREGKGRRGKNGINTVLIEKQTLRGDNCMLLAHRP